MQFANFYDVNGAMFDLTRFPQVVKKYGFAGRGVYLITGKLVKEFGAYSIENTRMEKVLYQLDPRIGSDAKLRHL